MNLLELENISKAYDSVKTLQSIDLQVSQGEWLAITGPSGSGKTTMMNIIGCMDKPSNGSVILDGMNIAEENAESLTNIRHDKTELIFQQFHLINYLTALENVVVVQYYHSMPDKKEALQALERVGLGDRTEHLPSQPLSSEQQKMCIARVPINYSMLVLVDEPTDNLGETSEKTVLDILRQLHHGNNVITVVMHDLEAAKKAQRTVVLKHGHISRIIRDGK